MGAQDAAFWEDCFVAFDAVVKLTAVLPSCDNLFCIVLYMRSLVPLVLPLGVVVSLFLESLELDSRFPQGSSDPQKDGFCVVNIRFFKKSPFWSLITVFDCKM